MRNLFHKHEFLLLVLIAVLCALIEIRNPSFLSAANIFDLLKSCVIPGILALGVLIVLISGNIDISFPAVAAFSMYVTCLIVRALGLADSLVIIFGMSALMGCFLGFLNAFFIHFFNLPALIVTLGTASLIRGFLLAFIGTRVITSPAESMEAFSRASSFQQQLPGGGTAGLADSFFIFMILAAVAWLILNHTLLGRGIYALGGAPEAARRVGFNIRRIQFYIYGSVGFLAGLAGIIHASSMREADPREFAGLELTVIAAVVLGGASITGGKGTVMGTILGVLLLVIIKNNLILVGLESEWHQVIIGSIIIASTGVTAWRGRRQERSA